LFFYGFGYSDNNTISIPAHFPNLTFENSLSTGEKAYLGIKKKSTFSLNDINSLFILVDLTNTYCVSCKKNIKIFNEVYKKTRADKKIKEKIKVIGIAIGNNQREVEHFKNEHAIQYPIVIDPEFTVHKALGEPRVPYTMFIRRDAEGKEIIFKIHKGIFESADKLVDELKVLCSENF
jgi:thiol-disulfide isomerase/thioredoxin